MNILKVLPTNRSIREIIKKSNNGFLPKCITIDEFEKRVVLIPEKTLIDKDRRVLFMKEAADFNNFSDLKIQRDYMAFLKSSDFLFGFFEELALEKISIDNIETKDTYAEYEKHLLILKHLLHNYKNILENNNYYDKITLPEIYILNKEYLKRFNKIEFFLEGYLSRFEIELFVKVAKEVELILYFETNEYNQKMIERFNEIGFYLETDYFYELNLKEKSIINKIKIDKNIKNIELYFAQNKIEQIPYLKKKIYDFIHQGITPENIAIITPDENFSKLLKDFDDTHIFNFAMGFSFQESLIYQRLHAFFQYKEELSLENILRIKRYFDQDFIAKINIFFSINPKEINLEEFFKFFINENDNERELLIYKNEIFKFLKLKDILCNYSLKNIIYLFLTRLKESRCDDINGGKITVMGVLESRLVNYEGIVILNFNEEDVPKKGKKDLFLSNEIRIKAGLPTIRDRENLQKSYYYKLMKQAKKVAICAIDNENIKPSRFLNELNIKKIKIEKFPLKQLNNIIIPQKKEFKRYFQEHLKMEFHFEDISISPTLFKTYLECKRKFYFKYVKKINEAVMPTKNTDEKDIGNLFHKVLKKLYEKENFILDEKKLFDKLLFLISKEKNKNLIFDLKIDIWLEKLKIFAQNEINRFKNGYKIFALEVPLKSEYNGFKINGKIDRIDIKNEKLFLIDYKTGKIITYTKNNLEKATDFQMEFYYILSKQFAKNIEEVGFYDLKKGIIVQEPFFEEKMLIMDDKFKLLKNPMQDFTLCEDNQKCLYCPYATICGRDEI